MDNYDTDQTSGARHSPVANPSADVADVYARSRAGDAGHTGPLQLLNNGSNAASKAVATPFKNANLTGNTTGTVTTDPTASTRFA